MATMAKVDNGVQSLMSHNTADMVSLSIHQNSETLNLCKLGRIAVTTLRLMSSLL